MSRDADYRDPGGSKPIPTSEGGTNEFEPGGTLKRSRRSLIRDIGVAAAAAGAATVVGPARSAKANQGSPVIAGEWNDADNTTSIAQPRTGNGAALRLIGAAGGLSVTTATGWAIDIPRGDNPFGIRLDTGVGHAIEATSDGETARLSTRGGGSALVAESASSQYPTAVFVANDVAVPAVDIEGRLVLRAAGSLSYRRGGIGFKWELRAATSRTRCSRRPCFSQTSLACTYVPPCSTGSR
jgi:hypothetical protein